MALLGHQARHIQNVGRGGNIRIGLTSQCLDLSDRTRVGDYPKAGGLNAAFFEGLKGRVHDAGRHAGQVTAVEHQLPLQLFLPEWPVVMNDVFKNVDTTLVPKRPEIFEGAQSTENDSVEPAVLLFQGADVAFQQPATEPANPHEVGAWEQDAKQQPG